MTTLTKALREDIAEKAATAAFADRFADHQARATALLEQVYRSVVSEAQEATMRALPREFFEYSDFLYVTVRSDGGTGYATLRSARLSRERPIPALMRGYLDDSSLFGPVEAMEKERIALDTDRRAFENDLYQRLSSFKTIEKMLAAWPEGKTFLPEGWECKYGGALVPVFTDINAQLQAAGVALAAA